jgi:hypothetical protein
VSADPTPPPVLYRFFNDVGELLYVSITVSPLNRFRQHEARKAS